MGYRFFHRQSSSLTRVPNEAACVNCYMRKSNYLSRKSGEQDRNCDAALRFVLLDQVDHKVGAKDSLLTLTMG